MAHPSLKGGMGGSQASRSGAMGFVGFDPSPDVEFAVTSH